MFTDCAEAGRIDSDLAILIITRDELGVMIKI